MRGREGRREEARSADVYSVRMLTVLPSLLWHHILLSDEPLRTRSRGFRRSVAHDSQPSSCGASTKTRTIHGSSIRRLKFEDRGQWIAGNRTRIHRLTTNTRVKYVKRRAGWPSQRVGRSNARCSRV